MKLDKYREKKTEEELYSDVNFITQDDASEFCYHQVSKASETLSGLTNANWGYK